MQLEVFDALEIVRFEFSKRILTEKAESHVEVAKRDTRPSVSHITQTVSCSPRFGHISTQLSLIFQYLNEKLRLTICLCMYRSNINHSEIFQMHMVNMLIKKYRLPNFLVVSYS